MDDGKIAPKSICKQGPSLGTETKRPTCSQGVCWEDPKEWNLHWHPGPCCGKICLVTLFVTAPFSRGHLGQTSSPQTKSVGNTSESNTNRRRLSVGTNRRVQGGKSLSFPKSGLGHFRGIRVRAKRICNTQSKYHVTHRNCVCLFVCLHNEEHSSYTRAHVNPYGLRRICDQSSAAASPWTGSATFARTRMYLGVVEAAGHSTCQAD